MGLCISTGICSTGFDLNIENKKFGGLCCKMQGPLKSLEAPDAEDFGEDTPGK